MASGRNSNDFVTKRRQFTTTSNATLTSTPSPLPTLPFDVFVEILCRLPVKLLTQLRCLCKSFNSLISDPKFAKKHLRLSTKRLHLIVGSKNYSDDLYLFDSPISSIFLTSRVTQTQISHPIPQSSLGVKSLGMFSCDGILCFTIDHASAFLWNPSIRKLNILPPLKNPLKKFLRTFFSFGYDHFIDNYKVVAISFLIDGKSNEIKIHTLGTGFWRKIHDCPYSFVRHSSGVFVSGTVNWLTYDASNSSPRAIVSLGLEKESYQKLSLPDLEMNFRTLRVLKDCLCTFAIVDMFMDVWVMKEYGNKDSWTKLYNVPYIRDKGFYACPEMLYLYEDDQMLIDFLELKSFKLKLGMYNSKNGTLSISEIQNINGPMVPRVYVESLISPCS